MSKLFVSFIHVLFLFIGFCSCNNATTGKQESATKKINAQRLLTMKKADTAVPAPFYYTVQPLHLNCYIPVLQSFVFATYNGLWVFMGGQKKGFHGTDNDPPPFPSRVANDSIWVVDINQQKSWGAPVFSNFSTALSATNSAYCQVGNRLYMCGGFTKNNINATNFNHTSDYFFEIDLNALVQYVQSGGTSSTTVITKEIQDPYVQVTGGAMVYSNSYFYLIGGQNYDSTYNSGITGRYTNAIRRFTLQQQSDSWVISDTASLIDAIHLHRRDMNVVPGAPGNGQCVILYGGVFTKQDEAYRNAVFINGLSTGNPTLTVDSMLQNVNQYSCAVATFSDTLLSVAVTSFFGGITYEMFDTASGKLVVGDHGVPMPFSNIVSTVVTGGINNSVELIQLPPAAPLLPAFMGANAVFIPNAHYTMRAQPRMLDIHKINTDTLANVNIGYIVGGIISMGSTSGTTPNGFVPTYPNPTVFEVDFHFPGVH